MLKNKQRKKKKKTAQRFTADCTRKN